MLTLFLSSLVLVFLLGIQQQNVTHEHYGWTFFTSIAIAAAQVFFVKGIVAGDYINSVLAMGFGGGFGAVSSILVHKRFMRRTMRATVYRDAGGCIGEIIE